MPANKAKGRGGARDIAYCGVQLVDRKLKPLGPVLEQWVKLIPRYADRHRKADPIGEPDYPFWYGERASLSSLAAAAWLAGGVALEEYAAPKRGRTGRADLWLLLDEGFVIEAKQLWVSVGRRGRTSVPNEIAQKLQAAQRDARELPKNWWGSRLGIAFVVPQVPESEEGQLDSIVQRFLKIALQPRTQGAWWFNSRVDVADDRYLYPGVLLVMENARRPGRG